MGAGNATRRLRVVETGDLPDKLVFQTDLSDDLTMGRSLSSMNRLLPISNFLEMLSRRRGVFQRKQWQKSWTKWPTFLAVSRRTLGISTRLETTFVATDTLDIRSVTLYTDDDLSYLEKDGSRCKGTREMLRLSLFGNGDQSPGI